MPVILKPKNELYDLPSAFEEPKFDHASLLPTTLKKFHIKSANSIGAGPTQSFASVGAVYGDFDTIDADEAPLYLGEIDKDASSAGAPLGYGPSFKLDGPYVAYSRVEVEAWNATHNFKRTPSACLNGTVQLSSGHSEA